MTDPSVSLLSGGEAARIVPVQGGGAGENQKDVKEWKPTEEDLKEIRVWAGNDAAMPVYPNKTTAIMLAGKIFMIRDPSRVPNLLILPNEIHQNWQDKILTPGEIDFLKELGVKEPQDLSGAFGPNWGGQIDKFFSSLVRSDCFKDTHFLSNRQCSDTREFLTKLTQSLITRMGPTTALGVSDEDLGPILELEEEKGILEDTVRGLGDTLKGKVADFEARRTALEAARRQLIDEIQQTKRVAGMPIDRSGAQLSAEWQKDVREDRAIEQVRRQTRGSEISALETMTQGQTAPLIKSSTDRTRYSKPMIFVRRGGDNQGETSTGYVFIKGAANEEEAARMLTAEIARLKREYPGWMLLLPG